MSKARNKADFVPDEYSGDNLIINGCMSENQRAQSGSLATTGYTLDRWVVRGSSSVGGTVNVNQIQDADLGYALQLQTSSATSNVFLYQIIEDLTRDLQRDVSTGEKYTLSFDAYSNVGENIEINVVWKNITDSSFTPNSILGSAILTNVPTRHEFTFELPSLESGYNISDEYGLMIQIRTTNTAVDATRVISNVKLERGYKATKFIPDAMQVNLAKCQRYYWNPVGTVYQYTAVGSNETESNSNVRRLNVQFPVTMRDIPSISYTSTLDNSISTINPTPIGFGSTGNSASPNGGGSLRDIVADAEL